MSLVLPALAALSLLAWLYLLALRGGFWRCEQRLGRPAPPAGEAPSVVAVVPARTEAAVIGRSLAGLLAQDYAGPFIVVVVDDHSTDATRTIATDLAAGAPRPLLVEAAPPLAEGWSGKLSAVDAGVRRAAALAPQARYLWLTDADIAHAPDVLSSLVAKAESDRLDLVSLMARLDDRGFWARLLIPAFVFFFQKLYPFAWANDPRRATAAAAGGCMLVRRDALTRAGGIAAVRGALIDDCALAAAIKHEQGGRIWIGVTDRVHSLRDNTRLGDIWAMVARTAFTQLRHSPVLLAGTLLGMTVIYLVPPLLVLSWPWHGQAAAGVPALAAWAAMAVAFRPTLRLYGRPPWLAALLPVAGLLYSLMTVDSALRHWRGRGGQWKGRTYGGAAGALSTGAERRQG